MPFKLGPLELVMILIIFIPVVVVVLIVQNINKKKQPMNMNAANLISVKTPITKTNLIQRINTYFGSSNYNILSQSENNVILQGGKDIDGCLLVVLLLLLLVGALIYWAMAKAHQVVVNWEYGDGFLTVTATGNTYKAQQLASNFLNSLPQVTVPAANPTNTEQTNSVAFCHKCGNKVTSDADYCQKCGAKIIKIS